MYSRHWENMQFWLREWTVTRQEQLPTNKSQDNRLRNGREWGMGSYYNTTVMIMDAALASFEHPCILQAKGAAAISLRADPSD